MSGNAPERLLNTPQDAGLTAVIDAWDGLPDSVRASILMLVKAASGNFD
jgi:hypothetical protein